MGDLKNITVIDSTGLGVQFPPSLLIVAICIGLAISLVFYLLRSFGLYTMAKKENLKSPYLAFIPIAWIYTATKLAGKVTFFGRKFKNFAGFALAVFAVAEIIVLFVNLVVYVPVVGYYLQGGEITFAMASKGLPGDLIEYPLTTGLYLKNNFDPYYTHTWIISIASVCSFLYNLFEIAEIIVLVMVYTGLFRRYWPEHSLLGCLFSIFGIFPIMVFAVRKREPVNYDEYMRAKFYGVHAQRPQQPPKNVEDPFGYGSPEASGKENSDPFPEFNDKREKDD